MSRYVCNIGWDEVPHLSKTEKDELYSAIPAYQRKARTAGIPILGSGVIYPFDESRIKVEPFDIPKHWKRCFGLDSDAGAGYTAIAFLAWDVDTQTIYVHKDYKSESKSKNDHVEAIRAHGTKDAPFWLPGVGDASGLLVTAEDSFQVIELYKEAGVDIELPDKAVEAGILDLYNLMNVGRFKVFSSCNDWFSEFRMYHRKDGRIVKSNDHVMDATRYGVRSGLARAKTKPVKKEEAGPTIVSVDQGNQGTGWMGM